MIKGHESIGLGQDRNPLPLDLRSDSLPIALRGRANKKVVHVNCLRGCEVRK